MANKLAGEFESGLSGYGGRQLAQVEDISSTVADGLAALGITDSEQLVAVASVEGTRSQLAKHLKISRKELDTMVNEAEKAIPSSLVSMLETPGEADLNLGALEPTPEMMSQVMAIPMMALEEEPVALPSSVNWAKRMPPTRNQAGRGTCVAFALAALHEFYRQAQNDPQDFSEQHLYYETKLIDGAPNSCGTWQSKAVQALADRGQCRENVWPYNPNPPCNNHGTMPSNARTDAAPFGFQTQALNPRDVNGIKAALSRGTVVTFSVPVLNSWYHSADTRRTGRITMPIGNEPRVGGHAMCFIGYQDDPAAPGGGYFMLRNSWGTGWGSQCPYGAGNGTIPYQYIAEHNWEAYTYSPEPFGGPRTVPLYCYHNPGINDHFYTTSWSELGGGRSGWYYRGIECYVYAGPQPGTVPLHRYWNEKGGDHFYTTDLNELGGGRYGWEYQFIQCYVYPRPRSGTVPLYRFHHPTVCDHFYTTDFNDGSGWVYEFRQCWVYPSAGAGQPSTGEETLTSAPDISSPLAVPETFRVEPEIGPAEGTGAIPETFRVPGGSEFVQVRESKRPRQVTITINVETGSQD